MEKLRSLATLCRSTTSEVQAGQLLAEITAIISQILIETVRNNGVPSWDKQLLLEQSAILYEEVIPKYSKSTDESLMNQMTVLMHYIIKLCYTIVINELSRENNMESIFYLCTSCSERSEKHTGALVKDLLAVYRPQLERLISSNDISYVEYLFDSFQSTEGFLRKKVISSTKLNKVSKEAAPAAASAEAQVSIEEQVETIKSIFNTYGDQFIISCLLYFDNDSSRVINALLEDNLPPQLANLDRSVQRVWIGKGGGKDNFINRYSNENSNNINQIAMKQNEQRYKQIEKERIRALERQEENDKLLISREYGDDYDDQYDDVVSSVSGPTPTASEPVASKKNNNVVIDWSVRMKETKRINTLIKQEEENLKYWQDLAIDNKLSSVVEAHDNSDEDGDDVLPAPSTSVVRAPNTGGAAPKGSNKSSSTVPTNTSTNTKETENKTKYRTKRFDKHHQKDKAQRKFGITNG